MEKKTHSSIFHWILVGSIAIGMALGGIAALERANAQSLNAMDRDRGHVMLKVLKNEIKKNYFDAMFRGIDLEARFKAADEKLDRATSLGQVFGIVAQVLLEFEDSHLFFIPPQRSSTTDYGWQMQMVGDKCYVSAVKPGSDAEAKGLKPGDQVKAVDSYAPVRENLWKLKYLYYALRPQPAVRVVVQSPNGADRQLDVMAKVRQGKRRLDLTGSSSENDIWDLIREGENEDRLRRHRYYEMGDEALIWKMPQFDLDERGIDDLMAKAKKRKGLVLDLRGNPGGAEETLKYLLGYFVDADVKIGDIKRRKETKELMVKARGGGFKGKLVVIIDGESGSSAEIFARMIQMEKAGTVIGDRSAGAVMRAKGYHFQLGADTVVFYGASITDADLIMTDGKSLERVGVTPDVMSLPTAADLAAKRDPVLARAAALVGVKLDPEKAGTMFPVEWRK
ncbi:MAG TPA: S41 family peptidase [Blastocatellia bacterium]|nr:S41 family peptidase [Blastocatellia bacterium]